MTALYQETLATLKENGHRLTQSRKYVLALLIDAPEALTPSQIFEILQNQALPIDLVSVYRTIDLLLQYHFVHKLSSGAIKWCHSSHHTTCGNPLHSDHAQSHHFFICSSCKQLTELDPNLLCSPLSNLSDTHQFVLHSYKLEMTGLCKSCDLSSVKKK